MAWAADALGESWPYLRQRLRKIAAPATLSSGPEPSLAVRLRAAELRRLEASALGCRVLDEGDDETPAEVVYGATESTRANWADTLL